MSVVSCAVLFLFRPDVSSVVVEVTCWPVFKSESIGVHDEDDMEVGELAG